MRVEGLSTSSSLFRRCGAAGVVLAPTSFCRAPTMFDVLGLPGLGIRCPCVGFGEEAGTVLLRGISLLRRSAGITG